MSEKTSISLRTNATSNQAEQQVPEKLTYQQVERIARNFAIDMTQEPETAAALMVLMREIINNPFDSSHVETIASLINSYLFTWTATAFQDAERQYITRQRAHLLTMIDGGTQ